MKRVREDVRFQSNSMTKHIILFAGVLCCLIALGCSKSPDKSTNGPTAVEQPVAQEKRIASVDVVKAVAEPVEISVGGSAELVLALTIQDGYHINANPPSYSYLIATELQMAPAGGVSMGRVAYPPPINVKLAFAEKPIGVYEGQTQIRATLKTDKTAQPGEKSLSAKLRIQACDNQVCFPPGTLDLQIPVRIK